MTPTDDAIPAQPAAPRGATSSQQAGNRGVVGNERLTALAGVLLLALLAVELVTSIRLRTLLSAHVVVGVVLAGPLAVKLGSTGYRFVRYQRNRLSAPALRHGGESRVAVRRRMYPTAWLSRVLCSTIRI
jgi:hypothetical protein